MPDKLDPQLWSALRIPRFFKWENGEQQIDVLRQFVRAARTRSPHLGRDVLNDPGVPVGTAVACVLSDGVGKTAIESRKVHANDRIGFALEHELQQVLK